MSVLTDIRNRGVKVTFFLVCEGLKGPPEVVSNVWSSTKAVQTYAIHLIRKTFNLASKQHWDGVKRRDQIDLFGAEPATARAALDEFTELWGAKYDATARLWENAWEEFISAPGGLSRLEISRFEEVVRSMSAIKSINARYRRAIRERAHFPTEQAALKYMYLFTRSLGPTGTGRTRWTMRWKPALNAFVITFADRWPAAETY